METNLTNVVVLFVESFSLILGFFLLTLGFLCILMDFPIQIAIIKMGLTIICFKGSQVDFPNKYVLQSHNIALIIANIADPDEMQHYGIIWVFTVCQNNI